MLIHPKARESTWSSDCDAKLKSPRLSYRHGNHDAGGGRLSMMADRLSAECVGAIMTAHEIGNGIGLSVLRNEILFAGIVGLPERAGPTLDKYDMSYEKVKETAIAQVRKSVSDLAEGGNKSSDALPFSPASKLLMDQALTIAEGLNSPSIRSEHVLLALMGYNNGNPIESAPALDVLSKIPGLRGIDGKAFSCFKFCEQLLLDLDAQPNSDFQTSSGAAAGILGPGGGGGARRDTVATNRGGLGLGTSTLNSIGVDLTQMALEGKLDNVYGRDAEIRSALRTLGRRRKNNPCLIGGKSYIHIYTYTTALLVCNCGLPFRVALIFAFVPLVHRTRCGKDSCRGSHCTSVGLCNCGRRAAGKVEVQLANQESVSKEGR